MKNWNIVNNKPNTFEHATEIGTFLYLDGDVWVLKRSEIIISQKVRPSDPFRWAEDIIANLLKYWG